MSLLGTLGRVVGVVNRGELVRENAELVAEINAIEAERNKALAEEDARIKELEDRLSGVIRRKIDKPYTTRLLPLNQRYRENSVKLAENPPAIVADALVVIESEIATGLKLDTERHIEEANTTGETLQFVRYSPESIKAYIAALRQKQQMLSALAHTNLSDVELRKEIQRIKNAAEPALEKIRLTRSNPAGEFTRARA